jgi:complex iron-sulfur molybdoenzyme family reductase subunit gamma
VTRRRRVGLAVAVFVIASVLRVADANPAIAQTPLIGAFRVTEDPGLDGTGAIWQGVPAMWLAMTPQQVTPPMGGGDVTRVAVRALNWNNQLFVMLEWADPTPDLGSARPEDYSDAVAVQFPAVAGTAVPAICMGQADQAVNIWQWRADSQQGVPSQPASGYVDLYPSTDDLYYPARAAGNPMAAVSGPVQNLVAGGFGTLTPAASQVVIGNGVYRNGAWAVVMSRSLASPDALQPDLSGASPIDTAFAVWDGGKGNRNGIKSVSVFVQMQVTNELAAGITGARSTTILVAAFGVILAGLVIGLVLGLRRSWRPGGDRG